MSASSAESGESQVSPEVSNTVTFNNETVPAVSWTYPEGSFQESTSPYTSGIQFSLKIPSASSTDHATSSTTKIATSR